jgi:predicted transposase YdaD
MELIETIAIYKFPSLSREAIETMLGLSELRQTKVYQEAMEEEARSLILRLLTRKFGPLPTSIEAQVQALALPQLEVLGEALLDFTGVDDLVRWFDSNERG